MSLVEKYALLPDEIDRESLKMVEASLPSGLSLSAMERYVLNRIVRAEGDPGISLDVEFSDGAVELGIAALLAGAEVVTDVRMVEVGISKALLAKLGTKTRCQIDTVPVAERALKESTTRSVAAIRELSSYLSGAVVAVGNAPTALLALLDLIAEGVEVGASEEPLRNPGEDLEPDGGIDLLHRLHDGGCPSGVTESVRGYEVGDPVHGRASVSRRGPLSPRRGMWPHV